MKRIAVFLIAFLLIASTCLAFNNLAYLNSESNKDVTKIVYGVCKLYKQNPNVTAKEIFYKVIKPTADSSGVCRYLKRKSEMDVYMRYVDGLTMVAAKAWYDLLNGATINWVKYHALDYAR